MAQGDKNKVHMNSVDCLPTDSAGGRLGCCQSAGKCDRVPPPDHPLCTKAAISGACLLGIVFFSSDFVDMTFNEPHLARESAALKGGGQRGTGESWSPDLKEQH